MPLLAHAVWSSSSAWLTAEVPTCIGLRTWNNEGELTSTVTARGQSHRSTVRHLQNEWSLVTTSRLSSGQYARSVIHKVLLVIYRQAYIHNISDHVHATLSRKQSAVQIRSSKRFQFKILVVPYLSPLSRPGDIRDRVQAIRVIRNLVTHTATELS
jgi:hypothetical protein